MPVYHLILATSRRIRMFPTETEQRTAVHKLAAVAARCVALFGLVLEHAHLALLLPSDGLWSMKGALVQALSDGAVEPVAIIHCERIKDPKHLSSLVRYFVTQPKHHRVRSHPALWSGTCFQDLVGARVVPGLEPRIHEVLPDLSLGRILDIVGLPRCPIEPATDDQIRTLGASRLVRAAAAALAVGPQLVGRSEPVVMARRLAAQLGVEAKIALEEMAWAIKAPMRTLRSWLLHPVGIQQKHAARRRLYLEQAVLQATGVLPELGPWVREDMSKGP